ncbi:response regulator [Paraglaciecola sp. 2405UD69-4]|uniref:response regulator n=1 Tax=Paraglaciecola sp. 2405UD69-4 TaxID=3391836 RepID=UPI0039C9FA8D
MAMKNARILLVEDDEDDYIIARDCLEELDEYTFEIDWVATPHEALEQLKGNQHDICLLDYQLGALNGLTVLEHSTAIRCRVPIIMLTGQSDKVLDKLALDAGAVDFIVKNELDSPRFTRAIRYALARQEVEKERLERINAETKSRSKDRFLAHLSHELRTPLTSILGYTELLLGNQKAEPVKDELNIILNNGKHLLSLLNDVLDLSKIAAKKLELNPTTIYLNSFLVDIYTLMQVAANDKGIKLRLSSITPIPDEIYSDPTRLRQILINLIYNAIKFTDMGSVEIVITSERQDDQYQIQFDIKDTGQGIPTEKIDKIFQPFEQVEDMVSRKEEGAGLGLAISSELATKFNGSISATSTVGEGSCFTAVVKCGVTANKHCAPLSLTKQLANDKQTSLPPLQGRILVVDDIPDIRMLIGHITNSFGLTVDFAENGKQALDKAILNLDNHTPYDAIIMDIHMPHMDGKEAVVAIRDQGFSGYIIALTAATMKGVEQQLRTLGFDGVISKPVDKALLHHSLSKVLAPQNGQKVRVENEKSEANEADNSTPSHHIMLVEDDVDAAEITKLLLESLGAKVSVAHSAEQCRALLATEKRWDKILLDLHLPDEYGLDLAKHSQLTSYTDELIIISGEDLSEEQLKHEGINRALLKPLNKQKLATLVT